MVLASQQARSGSGTSYMFAKRRSPRRRFVVGGVIVTVIVVFAAWQLWPGGSGADESSSTDPGAGEHASLASNTGTPGGMPGDGSAIGVAPNRRLPRGVSDEEGGGAAEPDEAPGGATIDSTQNQRGGSGDGGGDDAIVMGAPNGGSPNERNESNNTSGRGTGTPSRDETGRSGQLQTPTAPPKPVPAAASGELANLLTMAVDLTAQNRLVEARATYNIALHHPRVTAQTQAEIRDRMMDLSEILIFSPYLDDDDPFTSRHVIGSGDFLSVLGPRHYVDWRLIKRINQIRDENKVRKGAALKMVTGPFHAVVDKSDYRMDLYIGRPDSEGRRMYVWSFSVGLGEYNGTPTGLWEVRARSKEINPGWSNPRTGERFTRDDPNNPIGERWIGLRGADEQTEDLTGYGIHGTIEPESIGRQASMGCVRLLNTDVELVYEMLVERHSTVIIQN